LTEYNEQADPTSQFRLLPCVGCKNDDLRYEGAMKGDTMKHRAFCPKCGNTTQFRNCKHDAQQEWNGRFRNEQKKQ